jgi:hypothetical protein
MKSAILQIWEESMSDDKIIPDGASLHINENDRNEYVNKVYMFRGSKVPANYNRICGTQVEVSISELLYSKLEITKSIRLEEYEFNNLIKFKEIV